MLIHDDIFNIRNHVQEKSVDLIIYDPPYGLGTSSLSHADKKWFRSNEQWDQFESIEHQYEFYEKTLQLLFPLLKETGSIFIFGSYHCIFMLGTIIQKNNWHILNSIVWYKTNAMFNISRTALTESTEYIIWSKPSKKQKHYFDYEYAHSIYGSSLRNMWQSPGTPNSERTGHPHQKPIWLIDRLIRIACPLNGIVLDPMCGSGTTEEICNAYGTQSIGIEKNPEYFKKAQKRISSISDMFPSPLL